MASQNLIIQGEYPIEDVEKSIREIMSSTALCSISTINEGQTPWINNAYFSPDGYDLYFLSEPTTQHSLNIKRDGRVAIAIANSEQKISGLKRGLQINGDCAPAVDLDKAVEVYRRRFSKFRESVSNAGEFEALGLNSIFYLVTSSEIRIFDEVSFGEETWVDCRVESRPPTL